MTDHKSNKEGLDREYLLPAPGTHPPHLYPGYVSSIHRAPGNQLVRIPLTVSETTGPLFNRQACVPKAADLTCHGKGDSHGQRIIVTGRVIDANGHPEPNTVIEIWQANAAGRYDHPNDQHDAPLDPNFNGVGQAVTDDEGYYRFVTIHPGAYPWQNHYNAWRPAHIHFSLFGPAIVTRLVTQMYFPGDPLIPFDPIYNSIPDKNARERLIAGFDWQNTTSGHALGYRFDIVLAGRNSTPMEGK